MHKKVSSNLKRCLENIITQTSQTFIPLITYKNDIYEFGSVKFFWAKGYELKHHRYKQFFDNTNNKFEEETSAENEKIIQKLKMDFPFIRKKIDPRIQDYSEKLNEIDFVKSKQRRNIIYKIDSNDPLTFINKYQIKSIHSKYLLYQLEIINNDNYVNDLNLKDLRKCEVIELENNTLLNQFFQLKDK